MNGGMKDLLERQEQQSRHSSDTGLPDKWSYWVMMLKNIYLEINACMTSTDSVQTSFLMSFALTE